MSKFKRRYIFLVLCLLCIIGLAMFFYFKNNPIGKEFKIKKLSVYVLENYNYEILQGEVNDASDDEYVILSAGEQKLTEDMGPFYTFAIQMIPTEQIQEYSSGMTKYIVSDYGEFADHWIYLQNPLGGNTNSCALAFYQGDLTNEEVKRALYSVKLIYTYTDFDGKNRDYNITIDETVPFTFEDYETVWGE